MAILTGQEIINQINNTHIIIGNFDINRVQPNSYDVTLGKKLCFYKFDFNKTYLDSMEENPMITTEISEEGTILTPSRLYLMETVESVWSDRYVTEISGISSLARLGIMVHRTAGYANIGHEFKWILEVEVTHPIKIYPGMRIGQMYFHTIEGENNLQYNGKYTNKQMGTELCGSLNHILI